MESPKVTYQSKNGTTLHCDMRNREERLVLADLLQEDGLLQGELIQARERQHEASASGGPWEAHFNEAKRIRERILESFEQAGIECLDYKKAEDGGLITRGSRMSADIEDHHGLIRKLPIVGAERGDIDRVLSHPEACFVQELGIRTEWHLDEILEAELLQRINSLRILPHGWPGGIIPVVRPVAQASTLTNLKHLSYEGNQIGPDDLQQLEGLNLPGLVSLDLSNLGLERNDTRLDPETIQHLARAKVIDRLTHLNLGGNPLGTEGLKALLDKDPSKLTSLGLDSTNLNKEAMQVLAESEVARRLEKLDLSGNPIGDEGIETLLSADTLESLTHLELSVTSLGTKSPGILANAQCLRQLRILNISGNHIGNEVLRAMASAQHLPELQCLKATYNSLDDNELAKALAGSNSLPRLRYLALGFNNLSPEVSEYYRRDGIDTVPGEPIYEDWD